MSRSVAENTATGTNIGAPVSATGAPGITLTYLLEGADASSFSIVSTSGQLQTNSELDYEIKSYYTMRVVVSDGRGSTARTRVVISITNVDEAGTISVSPPRGYTGETLRARIDDPDGPITAAYQWYESENKVDWTRLAEERSFRFIPKQAQVGKYLRAEAKYTEGGVSKTLRADMANMVADRGEGKVDLVVTEHVRGLHIPWDIAFTPDGTMLITERERPGPQVGRLSALLSDGTLQTVTANMSDLIIGGEGGLMAVLADPDFSSNRRFYTCQVHSLGVQVISWTMNSNYTEATRDNDPLVNIPLDHSRRHAGCRLRIGSAGYLWIGTGDGVSSSASQDLTSLGGKVLRVNASTGNAAPGNPFSSPNSPLIYSYGHRNVQGLALQPGTNQMWSVEHGPAHDDEVNILTAGGNYGWSPRNHDGSSGYQEHVPMTNLGEFPDAIEAKWSSGQVPCATSGGIFLEGDWWGDWEGRLAVVCLRGMVLNLFEFTSTGDLESERLIGALSDHGRLRTPMMGPDNALYITTSNSHWNSNPSTDKILRISPQVAPEFPSDINTSLEVVENTNESTIIATITAEERNHEAVVYSLSGAEAASFNLKDTSVGALRANAPLDYETKSSYEVTLTATDSSGFTDSIALTITVRDVSEPPSAPDAPTVSRTAGSESSSLDISWTAPDNTGKPDIASYDLRYRSAAASEWTDGPEDQTGGASQITGLSANTAYEVQVRATNDEGDSAWSTSGEGTTGA